MAEGAINIDKVSSGEAGSEERISLSGEIAGNQVKFFESELLKIINDLHENTTLTAVLKNVERIDSRGISLIIGLFKECTFRKINLVIIADSQAFRILSQIKLNRVLTIKEETDARTRDAS